MKKAIRLLMGILMVGSLCVGAAGCGNSGGGGVSDGGNGGASDGGNSGGKKEKTVLSVINFRPEDQAYYTWMEEEFENKYPDIDVRYEAVDTAGYNTLLNSRLTANAVDVFGAQPAMLATPEFVEKMLPLNDLKAEDGSDFWAQMKDGDKAEVMIDGDYMMAPLSSFGEVVFYNKTMFEEYGQKVPTTWSEFVTLLDFFKGKQEAGEIEAPICYGGLDVWPICMVFEAAEPSIVRQVTPDIFLNAIETKSIDTPEMLDWFTKMSTVTQYFQENSTGTQYAMAPAMFAGGGYAMTIDGSWSLTQMYDAQPDFEIGAFPFPGSEDPAKNEAIASKVGGGFAVSKDSKNIEAAKQFVEFQFYEAPYEKYMNYMLSNPCKKDVTIDDPVSNEIAQMPTILTASNYWSYYDMAAYLRDPIGTGFVQGMLTPEEALKNYNENFSSQAELWAENLPLWYSRFAPDKQ